MGPPTGGMHNDQAKLEEHESSKKGILIKTKLSQCTAVGLKQQLLSVFKSNMCMVLCCQNLV